MGKRTLPSNVITNVQFGQAREKTYARSVGARLHPSSGSGSTMGDMTLDRDHIVLELKTVPQAKSHSVKLETLENTLRQAERIGGEAFYVVEFDGITLVGRVHRS